MKKLLFAFIIIILLLTNCNNSSVEKSFSMNQRSRNLSELKQQIINYGDSSAYNDLTIELLDFKYGDEELLPYAIIMANKFDYSQAYFDVFFSMTAPYMDNINQIDSITAKIAIDYLLLASEKGHSQACEIVNSCSITETCHDYVKQLCQIYR